MVTARAATKGLSTTDLETIRDTLGAGRKPKVMFTEAAGQIAGQIGQVVGLTDPELSDEWVVVRFGKDELPFSPIDLMIAPKAAPNRRSNTVPAPREESPVPSPAPVLSTVDSPADAPVSPAPADADVAPAGAATSPKAASSNSSNSSKTSSDASSKAASSDAAAPDAAPAPPDAPPDAASDAARDAARDAALDAAAAPAAAPAKATKAAPAKKAAKPKAPPSLTVTLSYAEGEWTVAANQGAKALAKPYLIKPAEALKMVSMLDVPGVHEAVEEIVSAARAEAEQQADRLRAELAEIEARLAELSEAE
jgi:hypothetical protein